MMMNTEPLFIPLLEYVDETDYCFYNSSNEYLELSKRLQALYGHVIRARAALRMINRLAATKRSAKIALEEILDVSAENIGMTTLAAMMLDDINGCLEHIEAESRSMSSDALDKVLD